MEELRIKNQKFKLEPSTGEYWVKWGILNTIDHLKIIAFKIDIISRTFIAEESLDNTVQEILKFEEKNDVDKKYSLYEWIVL